MVLVHELGHLAVLWAGGVASLSLTHSSSGFAGQPEFWRLLGVVLWLGIVGPAVLP